MAITMVGVLYFAWFLTWTGTFANSCTMGDYESLPGAMVLSFGFYVFTIAALPRLRLGIVGVILALPLVPLMIWQAVWGVKLFLVVYVAGRNACGLMFGGDYGEADGTWFEASLVAYYIILRLWLIGSV